MAINNKRPELIFETSWEVCNKIGGIYTVLSTKAKSLQDLCGCKLIFIGPDLWSEENPSHCFKESKTLLLDWRTNNCLPQGIKVRVGNWLVPGNPVVILIDYSALYSNKNQLYAEMWDDFKVDSLHAYGDYDESCVFSYGAALVIESYCNYQRKTGADLDCKKVVAHFDEWTTGMGLLYLKKHMPDVATVFTTHATSIGRSICCNNKPLYDYLHAYDGDQMAGELNMQSKHSLEKAAALNADAFTTVSEVTAKECSQLLGRTPIVTPNGFEQNYVPEGEKFIAKRKRARRKMLQITNSLLGTEYNDDTIFIATSGRNEFRNKGIDAFIDTINILRAQWKEKLPPVVAFIMVPSWIDSPREDLRNAIKSRKRVQFANRNTTHQLHDASNDSIYAKMNYLGLNNLDENNVKIIYIPSYLNGNDGIFNMSYYDLLIGLDYTIFASYYEPWGYTPLESVAFGVPTVTTDKSGFGQWILSNCENNFEKSGVKVVTRTDSNYSEMVFEIANEIKSIMCSNTKSKEKAIKAAERVSQKASWDKFILYYMKAYQAALQR